MAITFSRADNSDYIISDSATGSIRTYKDRRSFEHAALTLILNHSEEVEAGLARLQASYERPRPILKTPEEAAFVFGGSPENYTDMFPSSAPRGGCP